MTNVPRFVSLTMWLMVLLIVFLFAMSETRLAAQDKSSSEPAAGEGKEKVDFERDVRPILQRSCYSCHGPDKQTSGYRLDVRQTAFKGGDTGSPAIVPHDATASLLMRYVQGTEADMLMPPADSDLPKLSAEEIETLAAWINAGPSWPDALAGTVKSAEPHWSLTKLVQPEVPAGIAKDGNPIDAFVQAKLADQGLQASPEADRRTLIRRLTYGLTGLPPTNEEVEAFAETKDGKAYEELIRRLLASPRYGEHWARHWLDVAHYADTHGNDHDYARPNAWPYRDYVIRSFNEDKPYTRFVQEQVAGDAMFPNDPQATVALGFLAAGPWDETLMVGVREDTFDHQFALVLDRDDMVTTVMSTFQGLTVHCARCHNHKFDPISQREYYGLQAVFAGVDRNDRPYHSDEKLHAKRLELSARKAAIVGREPALIASIQTQEMTDKLQAIAKMHSERAGDWEPLDVISVTNVSNADSKFERQADGSWLVSGAAPDKDTFIITGQAHVQDLRALRLEVLPDERLPGKGPGRYDPAGNFHLTEFRVQSQPAVGETRGATAVTFSRVTADHSDRNDMIANTIDNRADTHWSIHPRYGEPHEAVFEFKEPLSNESGTTFIIRLECNGMVRHQVGRFRLSFCTGRTPAERRAVLPVTITDLLRKPPSSRTPEESIELGLQVLQQEVERELAALPEPEKVYAVTKDFAATGSFKPASIPRPIHVLGRGDINKPGELVGPGAIAAIPELGSELQIGNLNDESARRASLARWLTDDRNALLWRTIVNRVWGYHFGRGLCDTPNDFGMMGGTPSHPELLDWLAVWFRDEAHGSIKALHHLILTSKTYQQSVRHDEQCAAKDPDNRLLWRMNRTRLTAEQVRDSMLNFSGQLDLTMGGPAVVQFVDRGAATFKPEGGAPAFIDYESFSPDAPQNRRRAIYRFVFRTLPDPLMDALDAPDGGAITPVRSQSTTAVQAFALLNNAFVVRQCEQIATRANDESNNATTAIHVDRVFQTMLQRQPSSLERVEFSNYVQKHGLANAVNAILNCNEFVYLD